MRTTVDLDPRLLAQIRREADKLGVPFKTMLTTVLQRGLARGAKPKRPAYRCPTFAMGASPHVDLDHALRLADTLADEAIAHKLDLRK